MAFVALSARDGNLLGVVRLTADPDHVRAEYAIIVRSDLKGRGLGWQLMKHLIAYARAEGLDELYGTVLAENTTMLRMCRELIPRLAGPGRRGTAPCESERLRWRLRIRLQTSRWCDPAAPQPLLDLQDCEQGNADRNDDKAVGQRNRPCLEEVRMIGKYVKANCRTTMPRTPASTAGVPSAPFHVSAVMRR